MKHLAIYNEKEIIEKILNEEKTIEARLSRDKLLPYERIKKGDEVYLKESGGKIRGKVEVDNVLFYDHLSPEMIGKLRKEYNNEISIDDKFWEDHGKSKYASLIFLKNPQRFISPVKFHKRDRRGWIVIKDSKQ